VLRISEFLQTVCPWSLTLPARVASDAHTCACPRTQKLHPGYGDVVYFGTDTPKQALGSAGGAAAYDAAHQSVMILEEQRPFKASLLRSGSPKSQTYTFDIKAQKEQWSANHITPGHRTDPHIPERL